MRECKPCHEVLLSVLAFVIGFFVNAMVFIYLISAILDGWFEINGFIYKFQTLIGGILALIGALLTVLIINLQIKSTETMHKEQSMRRAFASRSMLPAALALFSQDVRASIDWLKAGLIREIPSQEWQIDYNHLRTPFHELDLDEVYVTIRDCIENGELPFRDMLADLISKYQIKRARMLDLSGDDYLVLKLNIFHSIYDNLEISTILARLYPYARRRDAEVDDRTEIQLMDNAANIHGFYSGEYPELDQLICRKLGQRC